MNEHFRQVDTAIVGGGLGGLAAAAYVGRSGRSVTVFERASTIGGRAVTHVEGGFLLNLGPHALYRGGDGMRTIEELGVRISGGVPLASGSYAIADGRKHALPGGFLSLLTTGLFGVAAKLETARLLGSLPRVDAGASEHMSVRSWLESQIGHHDVRALVAALFRVATYANCPDRQSAGAAIRQLQLALEKGVLYLDGGWQTLVDGLRGAAEAAGARIGAGTGVEAISPESTRWRLRLRGGESILAQSVILAVDPRVACDLLGGLAPASLRRFAAEALPVKAACLDVGLSRLPAPQAKFALGIDRPLYLSVHSAVAKLAPEGKALIHVARYLAPGESNTARECERELEGLLDLVQPGWREVVEERRFLPSMNVSQALPDASQGGLRGRPGPELPELPRLFLVGDWVGPRGMLADASFASARTAANLLTSRLKERTAA